MESYQWKMMNKSTWSQEETFAIATLLEAMMLHSDIKMDIVRARLNLLRAAGLQNKDDGE